MDILSVTKDVEGSAGLFQLPMCEIVYMEFVKSINRVAVHTLVEIFYLMGTLQYWQKAIEAVGHRFIWVDRTYVVNIDRVRFMDSVRHIAYFEHLPSKSSKCCTLTNIRFEELERRLEGAQGSPIIA